MPKVKACGVLGWDCVQERARAKRKGVSFFVGCHAVGLRFEEAAVGLRSEGVVGLRSEACGRSKV